MLAGTMIKIAKPRTTSTVTIRDAGIVVMAVVCRMWGIALGKVV